MSAYVFDFYWLCDSSVAEVIDTGQKAAGRLKDRQQFNGDITRDGQCESELTLP